jgi:malate dehydrogenase (oxaloacetate-decarboxylating)
LLDTRAKEIDEEMLVTASYAIASLVENTHLKEDYIIPKVNDPRILPFVTETLKKQLGVGSKIIQNQTKLDR